MVFQSSPGSPNVPWGTVCLDTDTADDFDVITPGKVFKEMQRLAWTEAEMVIQPPNGRTLVNLETNFLTTTTEPTTRSIQLLGHGVEIEATPVSYESLYLETGAMDAFVPARMLYERYGFSSCGPFTGYRDDRNSVFMTKRL
jgi:hypothetical protein